MNLSNKNFIVDLNRRMRQHFDGISGAYYKIVNASSNSYGYYHVKELEFIEKVIGSNKSLLVLDAGCGPGRHSLMNLKKGNKVVALDFSYEMIKLTRSNLAERADINKSLFVQSDVRYLPFCDECFDLIINMEVLEHLAGYVSDCERTIREFYRLLKRGGKLIIEVPLRPHSLLLRLTGYQPMPKGISKEEYKLYYGKSPILVANTFWEGGIWSLLTRNSFKIICKKYIRFFHEGIVESAPFLNKWDCFFESIPLLNKMSREVIWVCEK